MPYWHELYRTTSLCSALTKASPAQVRWPTAAALRPRTAISNTPAASTRSSRHPPRRQRRWQRRSPGRRASSPLPRARPRSTARRARGGAPRRRGDRLTSSTSGPTTSWRAFTGGERPKPRLVRQHCERCRGCPRRTERIFPTGGMCWATATRRAPRPSGPRMRLPTTRVVLTPALDTAQSVSHRAAMTRGLRGRTHTRRGQRLPRRRRYCRGRSRGCARRSASRARSASRRGGRRTPSCAPSGPHATHFPSAPL